MNVQRAIDDYSNAYYELYRRIPSELQDLGNDWVLVNGARMTSHELPTLTQELQKEYHQARAAKKGVVKRLLKWFSTAPTDL